MASGLSYSSARTSRSPAAQARWKAAIWWALRSIYWRQSVQRIRRNRRSATPAHLGQAGTSGFLAAGAPTDHAAGSHRRAAAGFPGARTAAGFGRIGAGRGAGLSGLDLVGLPLASLLALNSQAALGRPSLPRSDLLVLDGEAGWTAPESTWGLRPKGLGNLNCHSRSRRRPGRESVIWGRGRRPGSAGRFSPGIRRRGGRP